MTKDNTKPRRGKLADNRAANNTVLIAVVLHGRTLRKKRLENQAKIQKFRHKQQGGLFAPSPIWLRCWGLALFLAIFIMASFAGTAQRAGIAAGQRVCLKLIKNGHKLVPLLPDQIRCFRFGAC